MDVPLKVPRNGHEHCDCFRWACDLSSTICWWYKWIWLKLLKNDFGPPDNWWEWGCSIRLRGIILPSLHVVREIDIVLCQHSFYTINEPLRGLYGFCVGTTYFFLDCRVKLRFVRHVNIRIQHRCNDETLQYNLIVYSIFILKHNKHTLILSDTNTKC
jgi:hypothetical protein